MGEIPSDVFDLGNTISNISGDFFMGLSSEMDPRKGLPPVDQSEEKLAEVDGDDGVVDRPVDKGKGVEEVEFSDGKL